MFNIGIPTVFEYPKISVQYQDNEILSEYQTKQCTIQILFLFTNVITQRICVTDKQGGIQVSHGHVISIVNLVVLGSYLLK